MWAQGLEGFFGVYLGLNMRMVSSRTSLSSSTLLLPLQLLNMMAAMVACGAAAASAAAAADSVNSMVTVMMLKLLLMMVMTMLPATVKKIFVSMPCW